MSNGKGSKRRPRDGRFCSTEQLENNWAMAFGKKDDNKEKLKEVTLFGMPVITDNPNDKTEYE